MDKLKGAENVLQEKEKQEKDFSDADFVVTTGRGRKGKAHIPRTDGGASVCGHEGDGLKPVDGETVDKFYSVCSICRDLS